MGEIPFLKSCFAFKVLEFLWFKSEAGLLGGGTGGFLRLPDLEIDEAIGETKFWGTSGTLLLFGVAFVRLGTAGGLGG